MNKIRGPVCALLLLMAWPLVIHAQAQQSTSIVVFSEAGFPAADSAAPSPAQLQALFPSAQMVGLDALKKQVASAGLLVLPYGSAFPEDAWGEINQFLQRGGNLLVPGGRPFTRSAHHDTSGWHLRDYGVRFARALMIDQYQPTPGSDGLEFQTNRS